MEEHEVSELLRSLFMIYKSHLSNSSYYPSIFVLRPGQHLHINKGRLHTFRKVKAEPLEQDDCHHDLRRTLLNEGLTEQDELCISVAFDW